MDVVFQRDGELGDLTLLMSAVVATHRCPVLTLGRPKLGSPPLYSERPTISLHQACARPITQSRTPRSRYNALPAKARCDALGQVAVLTSKSRRAPKALSKILAASS